MLVYFLPICCPPVWVYFGISSTYYLFLKLHLPPVVFEALAGLFQLGGIGYF